MIPIWTVCLCYILANYCLSCLHSSPSSVKSKPEKERAEEGSASEGEERGGWLE